MIRLGSGTFVSEGGASYIGSWPFERVRAAASQFENARLTAGPTCQDGASNVEKIPGTYSKIVVFTNYSNLFVSCQFFQHAILSEKQKEM